MLRIRTCIIKFRRNRDNLINIKLRGLSVQKQIKRERNVSEKKWKCSIIPLISAYQELYGSYFCDLDTTLCRPLNIVCWPIITKSEILTSQNDFKKRPIYHWYIFASSIQKCDVPIFNTLVRLDTGFQRCDLKPLITIFRNMLQSWFLNQLLTGLVSIMAKKAGPLRPLEHVETHVYT